MSIAQSSDVGSVVGELYDSQQIGLLSEKAGLPLTAYQTDNVITYVNLLKKLLSDQKAIMFTFNVIPEGPHSGFPNTSTDETSEHGALALGYLKPKTDYLYSYFTGKNFGFLMQATWRNPHYHCPIHMIQNRL